MKKLFNKINLLVFVLSLLSSARALAGEELRLYGDIDANVLRAYSKTYTLRPMLRSEQRFNNAGLTQLKIFAGARADYKPWLTLEAQYAHLDKYYGPHSVEHMLVFNIIPHFKFGPVVVSDRNGNEWHSAPGYYRYRNELRLTIDPSIEWLRPFVADEIRFDSDEGRLVMNDLRLGLTYKIGKQVKVCTFYDLEAKRRGKPDWVLTNVYGLLLTVRL